MDRRLIIGLVFILCISSVYAAEGRNFAHAPLSTQYSPIEHHYCQTWNITAADMEITEIHKKASGDTATKCYVLDFDTKEELGRGTYSSLNCTLDSNVATTQNKMYLLCGHNNGASWGFGYTSSYLPQTYAWATAVSGWTNQSGSWVENADQANHVQSVSLLNVSGGAEPPPPEVDLINLSIPVPNNYPAYDINNIQINLTGNFSREANVTLYLNDAWEQSKLYGPGQNLLVNFSLSGLSDGNYTFYINASVYDGGLVNDSEATSVYAFVVDTADPTLTTDFINETVHYQTNLTGSFNFSDNVGLHTVNLSIDGEPLHNITSISDFTYNYTLNYGTGTLSYGWHNLTVYWADGHTAKKLKSPKDYNPSNGLLNDYMKYTFTEPYKPGHIKIKGLPGSMFDTFTTEYNIDRYKIKYKPQNLGTTYSFSIESSDILYIYNNPLYGGDWAVFGEHWIDFYIPGEPNLNVEITKINDYEANVVITGISPTTTELVFNSVGDLNTVTKTYTFFSGNLTSTHEPQVIAGESQTIVLNMSKGDGVTTDADLYYNNTLRSTVKDSYSDYDIYTATFTTPSFTGLNKTFNYSWNYSLTGPTDTEKGHVNSSNLAFNYGLDNCTLYNTRALNITFIDLDDYNPIEVELIFQATGDAAYYYEDLNGTANASFCIYPSFATLSETLAIQYDSVDTYYYNSDINLTNVTQELILYVQDSSGVTTFTVKDKSTGATLEDAYATMYRKINGSFQVIQSKYTDITGRVQFSFDASAEYQFFLSKSGYEPYDFILNPIIFDSYDVLMDPTFTTNQTWDYDRIGLLHEPEVFYNGQENNFSFFIHSPYSELLAYSYTLVYPGGSSSNSGASPVGEELTSNFTITGAAVGDKVELTYSYETDKAGVRTFNYDYEIIMQTGNNTMFGNRNRTYGMGLFERLFVAVFFVILVVGIASLVGQPLPGLGLGLLLYGYFVYIGFIPIWTVLITIAIGIIFLGARPDG